MNNYIDLHLHLDGAITADIARKLANMQGIELEAKSDDELNAMLRVPSDCKNLMEFLKCFALPCKLLQTKEAISEAVYLVLEKCKNDGCVYVEIRYAPQLHTDKGLCQEDAIQAAIEGLKRSDMRANLILCCMRAKDNHEANLETVRLAGKYLVKTGGVVAVDLAGAESLIPAIEFKYIFDEANKLGVPFTIHAGEDGGADNVRLAIEFGASRVGHGVHINEDMSVVELVKNKGICLEMCPTSNIQTCSVSSMDKHPVVEYLKAGLKVTINTDDPAIEGTTIGREFEIIKEYFDLDAAMIKQLMLNAVDAAFTSDEVKEELRKLYV